MPTLKGLWILRIFSAPECSFVALLSADLADCIHFRQEVKTYRNSGSKFWGSRFRVKLAKEKFYCKTNAKLDLFLLVAYADLHVSPEQVLCSPGVATVNCEP
jgi:hypothetical protein